MTVVSVTDFGVVLKCLISESDLTLQTKVTPQPLLLLTTAVVSEHWYTEIAGSDEAAVVR